MLKNYGVINNFQRQEIKDKIKQTCLDKYGVEYSAQAENTKNHIKESCLNHYGSTSYLQSNDYNWIPIADKYDARMKVCGHFLEFHKQRLWNQYPQ